MCATVGCLLVDIGWWYLMECTSLFRHQHGLQCKNVRTHVDCLRYMQKQLDGGGLGFFPFSVDILSNKSDLEDMEFDFSYEQEYTRFHHGPQL